MKKNIRKIKTPGESTIKSVLQLGHFALTRPGFNHLRKKILQKLTPDGSITYNDWFSARYDISVLKSEYEKNIHRLIVKPKISVIFTIDESKTNVSQASLQSVLEQLYPYWELCVVYNGADKKVKEEAGKIKSEQRIKIVPAASADKYELLNAGVASASHDYLLFLENGALLSPDCLYQFAVHLNHHSISKLVYAGEDRIRADGAFSMPYFKPCWSPDTFLSKNYIGNPIFINRDLWNSYGGCRAGYEGNEVYDLLLRATDVSIDIGHIPRVLYHEKISEKQRPATAAAAIAAALDRRGTPGSVIPATGAEEAVNITYAITDPGKVSIIIPTKDQEQLLKTAIDSIFEKTDYADFEVIVISNNSTSPGLFALTAEYERLYGARFKCITADFQFNFSKLINLGVEQSNGKYILMLNNDIEVISCDWLRTMVSYAQHKHVGAVGAKLLYPDDTIQHAGISLGATEASTHVFANREKNDNPYPYFTHTTVNYTAVTGACLLCRKDAYLAAGGMDEHLPVEYNDIDLCLKFLAKGYYNVYLPMVELYHYESATRGHPFRSRKAWKQHEKDLSTFKGKWGKKTEHDLFFNPLNNLTFLQ